MRLISLGLAAAAAVGLAFATSPANALTAQQPAGLQLAVEDIEVLEAVHCRRFRHRHRYGHGWSRGCRPGVVIVVPGERRRGYRERTRVRIERRGRTRTETRGRTRTKGDITVRGKADVRAKGTGGPARAKGGVEAKKGVPGQK